MGIVKRYKGKTFTDFGVLILRIFLGVAMLWGHGISKWEKLFGGGEIKFADPFGIGEVPTLALTVFAEVICSLLVAFGLFTRWALVPLIITMAVAVFKIHIDDGFGGMEKALLYGIGYITVFLTGPGSFSLDALFNRK
jgi:putative oxidoreductase